MFTGIVEETGIVSQPGTHMKILCRQVLEDSFEGSSIAVNGVCLTATKLEPEGFWMDLSPETLARTNLGTLREGSRVNLERPVAIGDRLSGHIVQGHVDGTGELIGLDALEQGNWWLRVRAPGELSRYLIHKGSIAIDGVSLTIAELDRDTLAVAVIPHTYAHTALSTLLPGSRVNLEVDMIAKYVEKLMDARK